MSVGGTAGRPFAEREPYRRTRLPYVILRTGTIRQDGTEEILAEYLCDFPNCPNPAEHVVGVVRELGGGFVVCSEHAVALKRRNREQQG